MKHIFALITAVLMFLPALAGWWLWTGLAPAGFWQMIVVARLGFWMLGGLQIVCLILGGLFILNIYTEA